MQQTAGTQSAHIRFTHHAQLRSQQRGLRGKLVCAVYDHADIETHVGSSCRRLSISSQELRRLISERILTPAEAERCKNVAVIVDGAAVITAYRH